MNPLSRILLMGVSGAGKTTVGRLLAEKLDGIFCEGDDLHPQVNIDKMRRGIALTDEDRRPWLNRVAKALRNLRYRITPFGDLTHRVLFKLVTEIYFAHIGLLASNLGKKVSTNLGAIQVDPRQAQKNKEP